MDAKRPARPEWYAGIEALRWIPDWDFFALCTGVVIEVLVTRRSDLVAPFRPLARSVVVLAAAGFAVLLFFAVELAMPLVLYARRQAKPLFVRRFILTASAIIGLGLALYTSVAVWVLRGAWRILEPLSLSLTFTGLRPSANTGWLAAILLIAGSVIAAGFTALFANSAVRNFASSVRVLGSRRALRGVALMLLLRLRQPRRDFFEMTPVVSDMRRLAVAAVLYAVIPGSVFAALIASIIVILDVAILLERIRPPACLFLGVSNLEAFTTFSKLRDTWGFTAVTLLDRTNDEGQDSYDVERTRWSKAGCLPKGFFYDPNAPRTWSLRSRPDMWGNTVLLLIDFVPRVVVDVRQMSDYVRQELIWLAEPGRIEKAWFLAGEEGLTPALAALIPPAGHGRVVSEEVLTRIAAPESDPAPPPAPPDRSPTPDRP